MKNVTKHFKIWLAITLVIVVVGMTLFGIFGTNKTADMGKGYEVQVSVDSVVTEATASTIKSTSEKYLNDNGYDVISYLTQTEEDGKAIIFRVRSLESSEVKDLQANLADLVQREINVNGLNYVVTVGAYESQDYTQYNWAFGAIAFAILAVVVFVYYTFMEKLSGALTVLCNMAISAALFIAMVGAVRLPVDPYFGAGIAFAVALAGVLSGGIVNRCRELTKNVANDKKDLKEIANEASWSSLTRLAVLSGAVLVVSIMLAILASGIVKLMAAQMVLATLVATFTAYAWTGFFWATFKKFKKAKKYKAEKSVKTEN